MPPGPEPISDILAQLMAQRGFTRTKTAANYEKAWREAAGELLAEHTRIGGVRRGRLEVIVAHSALAQELSFRKSAILKTLARLLPDEKINDLRVRVGMIE